MALSISSMGDSQRYEIIANPASGGGTGGRAIPRSRQILDGYGLYYHLVTAERPWQAAEMTADAVLHVIYPQNIYRSKC